MLKHFSLFLNFFVALRATRKTVETPKEAMKNKSSLDSFSAAMLDGMIAWGIEEKRRKQKRKGQSDLKKKEKGEMGGAPSKGPQKRFMPRMIVGTFDIKLGKIHK